MAQLPRWECSCTDHALSPLQIPLVLSSIEDVKKTKEAIKILERFGAGKDLERCAESKKLRAGVGKSRNRRYVPRCAWGCQGVCAWRVCVSECRPRP